MDDVVFDAKVIRNTYPRWRSGTEMVQILAGADAKRTVNNVDITRNSISSSSPVDACIWSNAGNDGGPEPGTIRIAGNTCSLSPERLAAIVVGPVEGRLPAFPHQRYVIADNVITGLAPGKVNIGIAYAPTQLSLNGNTYDPRGGFAWNTRRVGSITQRSFADWRTVSAEGQRSKLGTPSSSKRQRWRQSWGC